METYDLDRFIWDPKKRVLKTCPMLITGSTKFMTLTNSFKVRGKHTTITFRYEPDDSDSHGSYILYKPTVCLKEYEDIELRYFVNGF
jgi:hypothetical protein